MQLLQVMRRRILELVVVQIMTVYYVGIPAMCLHVCQGMICWSVFISLAWRCLSVVRMPCCMVITVQRLTADVQLFSFMLTMTCNLYLLCTAGFCASMQQKCFHIT